MKNLVRFIGILVFAGLLCACTKECYVPQKARMGITFLSSSTLTTLVPGTLTIQGVGSDSVLYNTSSAYFAALPLKANADSTQFNFGITNDTLTLSTVLTIWHKSKPQLISEECGCVVFHYIDSIRFAEFPDGWDLEIYDAEVTNVEGATHVQITIP